MHAQVTDGMLRWRDHHNAMTLILTFSRLDNGDRKMNIL